MVNTLAITFSLIIAFGVFNVWVLRNSKATRWRPEGAGNMSEEFRHYGLPEWAHKLTGALKLLLAALFVLGIWYSPLAVWAGVAMSVLMAGAVGAHLRVHDPLLKSLPAFSLMLLSLFVTYANLT